MPDTLVESEDTLKLVSRWALSAAGLISALALSAPSASANCSRPPNTIGIVTVAALSSSAAARGLPIEAPIVALKVDERQIE